jgi:hypothetical protein
MGNRFNLRRVQQRGSLFAELHVGFGSWLCKNALAIALTLGNVGDIAARGHFRRLVVFLLEALLMRTPTVLGNSATADGRMWRRLCLIAAISGLVPMMFMTRVRL